MIWDVGLQEKNERRTSNVQHRMLNKKQKDKLKLFPLPSGERVRVRGCFEHLRFEF